MKTIDDGGNAFPLGVKPETPCCSGTDEASRVKYLNEAIRGMSLRAYFVGKLAAGLAKECGEGCDGYIEQRARVAVKFADALIAALKET